MDAHKITTKLSRQNSTIIVLISQSDV